MARKARHRISYVLPLSSSPGGHLLGINGLAVDRERSILYSGGRDGVICAWDLDLDLTRSHEGPLAPITSTTSAPTNSSKLPSKASIWRGQIQAHTHWINDIVLAHDNTALVSASSDLTVKVWRPHASDSAQPETIGLHSDYVKCLATPSPNSQWVASGGLDHKIYLWDLDGKGRRLQIDVGGGDASVKGSVYALSVAETIMASGGPESVVRVWDPRTGKRVTDFVGHTDNVRDVLISDRGDTIITASSDQTVKVWSVTAGRCMHTLTMHNDSVWALYSEHAELATFYSGDRSGLVAKTDVRGTVEMDDGLCVAVCQEHGGINTIVTSGEHLWTATASSSINRWADVETTAQLRASVHGSRRVPGETSRRRNSTQSHSSGHIRTSSVSSKQIPPRSILPLTSTGIYPTASLRGAGEGQMNGTLGSHSQKPSEVQVEPDTNVRIPVRGLPEESIEGQHGLIKHIMLNDRRRVLTLDTAGEVMMWDLVKCEPIQSFGKRHLEDVAPEVNTTETMANWATIDTRTGRLTCVLEENYCFDAETYADELELPEPIAFREDQRINLGKWVLRYLFANLIDEEIRRDELFRKSLSDASVQSDGMRRDGAPSVIPIPSSQLMGWDDASRRPGDHSDNAPRTNGTSHPLATPGFLIGVATPAVLAPPATPLLSPLPSGVDEGAASVGNRASQYSQTMSSADRTSDYFASVESDTTAIVSPVADSRVPLKSPVDGADGRLPTSPGEGGKPGNMSKEGGLFSKKFRMSFGSKKSKGAVAEATKVVVAVAADEKAEESDASTTTETRVNTESLAEDNLLGLVRTIRNNYGRQLKENAEQAIATGIIPSMPHDTPVLKIPAATAVIIQEDRPDSGGVADLYRGTVGSVGRDADVVEKAAPRWLGNLLLCNQIPAKETVKVSFVLQPYQDLLPNIATIDGNARLNANRMLRARKILGYVAERIEPQSAEPDPDAMKAEEYLELYCQNQLVPITTTLATLRAHVWRVGGDVVLHYKSNGKRKIVGERTPEEVAAQKKEAAPPAKGGVVGSSSSSSGS